MRQVLKVGRRVWGVARSREISEQTLGNWCGRVRTFSDRAPVRAARGLAQRLLCVVAPRSRLMAVAQQAGLDLGGIAIEDVPHSHAAAARAVAMVQEGQVQALMKALPDLIFTIDVRGKISHVNDAVLNILRLDLKDVLGLQVGSFLKGFNFPSWLQEGARQGETCKLAFAGEDLVHALRSHLAVV